MISYINFGFLQIFSTPFFSFLDLFFERFFRPPLLFARILTPHLSQTR